mmetsp:Transcript_17/g.32  ORF Transcript_17/g.32 Transcript_17/m.32 type:complete len:204 (+) Transcript_17:184-795(+)
MSTLFSMGFPASLRSCSFVSVNSPLGKGWSTDVADSVEKPAVAKPLLDRSRVLRSGQQHRPSAKRGGGRDVREFSSRYRFLRELRDDMEVGIDAMELFERVREVRLGRARAWGGMEFKEFLARLRVLSEVGRGGRLRSVCAEAGVAVFVIFLVFVFCPLSCPMLLSLRLRFCRFLRHVRFGNEPLYNLLLLRFKVFKFGRDEQ